jgi:uncharacterized repeat protein (TIGR01451 family)
LKRNFRRELVRLQRLFGMSIALMLIFAFILGGSVLSMRAGKSEAHSVPPFVDGSVPSSAACSDFVLEILGIFEADLPDPGWVPVNKGNPGFPQFRSVAGEVTKSQVTYTDYPDVHDSHDQNTDILVDPAYLDILSDAGKDENGDGTPDTLELEWETGILTSEFSGDGSAHFFPKWAWPNVGDRVWANGDWIFDCGHPEDIAGTPHTRTEIHPARAIASMRQQMRTLPGSGTTPVPVTATDLYIHGRAGVVTDVLDCGQEALLGAGTCTIPFGGHDPVADHHGRPIDENFEFDVCTPPLPFDKATLATFVEDGPGNTLGPAPVLTVQNSTGACASDPAKFGPSQVHVTVPLAGSGATPDDVYARKIYTGWVFPSEGLRHLKATLNLMDLHDDKEPAGFDGELTFFWLNLDRAPDEWIRLSDFATGNMNDYDDDAGLGDGEMGFSGAAFDFFVGNGQPYSFHANGYDGGFGDSLPGADCLDDTFGEHDFASHVDLSVFPPSFPDFCYVLLPIDVSIPDNDPYNNLGASFGPADYGVGSPVVGNPGNEYELHFTVEDIPLAAEDSADLFLTKDCKPDEGALAGKQFTCTILVENPAGPGLPRNVVVHDTMLTDVDPSDYTMEPPTFTFGGLGGLTDPCEPVEDIPGGKEFKCNIGTVPIGGKAIVTMNITSDEGGDFNNYADVASESADADLSNNTGHDSVHVTPVADLQSFSVFGAERQVDGQPGLTVDTNALPPLPDLPNYNFGGTTVTAGRRIEFTTSTQNNGPSRAENVWMEFLLPFGASVIENTLDPVANPGGASGRCYTEPAGELRKKVICQYDTLEDGETAAARFQVLMDPALPDGTQLSFDQLSRSDQFDPNLGNNATSLQFDVDNWGDLGLVKGAFGTPVAGTDITYGYQVSNHGPSVSYDVSLQDQLPSEVEFLSAFVDYSGGLGGVPLPCTVLAGNNELDCPLGDVAPTGTVPIAVWVNVHIKANTPDGALVVNNASLIADTPDPFLADNSDSATVPVIARADLSILKSTDRDLFKPSTTVKYTIAVTNKGPSDAQSVVVVDTLPDPKIGYWVFDTGYLYDPNGCSLAGTTLTCEFGTLAAGASIQFDIYFRVVGNKGVVTNRVTVSSTTFDPVAANNTAARLNLVQGKDTGKK